MAHDNRIKNKAGFLKDNLRVDLFLEELLEGPHAVLRESERCEISAVLQQRGRIEANRCLLNHLLVGKWKNQIDQFVRVLFKYQPNVALEVDPKLCEELEELAKAAAKKEHAAHGESSIFESRQSVATAPASTATPGRIAAPLRQRKRPDYLDNSESLTVKQVGQVSEKLASRERFTRLTDEMNIEPDDVEEWINKDGINTDQLRAREILLAIRRDGGLTVGRLATAMYNCGYGSLADQVFMKSEANY